MDNTILLIQPPAGTASALFNNGIAIPPDISQANNISVNDLVNKIKTANYRFVIMGLTINGNLESGLNFINFLISQNKIFPKTIFIIYTYQGLVGNLHKFIEKNDIKLPNNWLAVPKETTYIFEHDDLIKRVKELMNK